MWHMVFIECNKVLSGNNKLLHLPYSDLDDADGHCKGHVDTIKNIYEKFNFFERNGR